MAEVAMELPLRAAVNLRGSGDAFLAGVERTIGIRPPVAANRFVGCGGSDVVWLGPDEWLVLGQGDDGAELEERLRVGAPGCVATDVTGNRICLRLSGAGARDLIAAGCSLDLHPRAFGPGRCAQTLLARAGVLLLQRDDVPTYDLLVRRSFARYVTDWLAAAAELTPARLAPRSGGAVTETGGKASG